MNLGEFKLVNAFTSKEALGNQCAVLIVDDLSNDLKLQQLAADFNLPATSFLKQLDRGTYQVRWFAPMAEIPICGHGTLGAAHALFAEDLSLESIRFAYNGGEILVWKTEQGIAMQSEVIETEHTRIPALIQNAFHGQVVEYHISKGKHVVVLDSSDSVRKMKPEWELLRQSKVFAFAITAQDSGYDFISRTLLPNISFLEDQATGSSHFVLAPFWSKKLDKGNLHAFQASERGGEMTCTVQENKVILKAHCKTFAKGLLCD